MKPRRVAVRFEGHVQGVGFRYTAVHIAQQHAIPGFVRNEFDGTVELVAEGLEPEINDFLAALRASHLGRFITRESTNWTEASGEFRSFSIRRDAG